MSAEYQQQQQQQAQQQPQLSSEDTDGIRWSWATYPGLRLEAARMVVPLGALYTPVKQTAHLAVLPYEPVRCKSCSACLNPYCSVDFRSKLWVCPLCTGRNTFPPHYGDISESNLPAELYAQYTTIEYTLNPAVSGIAPSSQRPNAVPAPFVIFVVDLAITEAELKVVKDSIAQVLNLLPEQTNVGLVTYGANVSVYELGFPECVKSFVLRGNKEYTPQQVAQMLQLPAHLQPSGPGAPGANASRPAGLAPGSGPASSPPNRFLLPLSDCLFSLESILEETVPDPWPKKQGMRAARCTGTALSVALALAESVGRGLPGRVVLMTGGACTVGPGMIVEEDLSKPIRSHSDIEKNKTPASLVKPATKYFTTLAERAAGANHVVDIFACSLDQVGLHEMRPVVHMTGGLLFLNDLFETDSFRGSFLQLVESCKGSYHALLDVYTSREWKVSGVIGSVTPVAKKSTFVGETEIGYGGTSAWRAHALTPSTTLAVYFEVSNAHAEQLPPGQIGYVQFTTQYIHAATGQVRFRVTTLGRAWTPNSTAPELALGFDQEAAAVLVARLATFRTFSEDKFDIIRWLDRLLIRVVQKFSEFRKDDPSSLRLSPSFTIYPQFMFHLRRSSLIQTFNHTPDESSYFRETFLRQPTMQSLTIFQPTLQAFSFEAAGVPVLLDATSITPDRILFLDAFFVVVLFHGETIANWRKAGYHEQEAYASFRQLLDMPRQVATPIVNSRFPRPRYILCDQHDSASRELTSRVNPSVTHQNQQSVGDVVFTEDVSLQVFMDHLRRLAVTQ
eukprot:ANDGO_04183.mRNA.1 Protein transport protein SEC23